MTTTFPSNPSAHGTAGAAHPGIACSTLNATIDSPAHGRPLLDGVSVNLVRGEVTAITGRPRSGARELGHVLAGQRSLHSGHVLRGVDRVAHVPAQLDAARLSDAVTRALSTDPELVVVDMFGWATSEHVIASLRTVAGHRGMTVVLVTDDTATAVQADRVLVLADGRLVDDL